jgi:hypothetical protein
MGYQADVQTIENAGLAVWYVTKYLTKTLQFSNFGKGFHRVRTSGGFPKLPEPGLPPGWTCVALPKDAILQEEIDRLLAAGYEVAVGDGMAAWAYVDAKNEKTPCIEV